MNCGGAQCLQFAATPNDNVTVAVVNIRTPLGETFVFNTNNVGVVANFPLALQNANEAYPRISGNWTFQFIGKRSAGSQASFDVTTSVPVSAVHEELPNPEIAQ